LAAGIPGPAASDPAFDAPDRRVIVGRPQNEAPSYEEALKQWRNAEDVNAWIGANFEYDTARAVLLSETQRGRRRPIPIHRPDAFVVAPRGVCADLARFAVETLRKIDPEARPVYVMIEFDPVFMAGNTLRRHWLVSFQRDGRRYFFADSKRPGTIAGPYERTR